LKGSRRFIPVCVAVLAIVLMGTLLAACGSSVKTYTDAAYGYGLSYPGGWKVQSGGTSDATAGGSAAGTVGIYNPKGTIVDDIYVDLAMVMVYKLNFTVDDPWSSDIQTELEGLLTQLEGQATDMKVEQTLAQTTVAGLKGYAVTYTFTKGSTPTRSTLYFLFSGSVEYEITQQAAVTKWDETKPALESILVSFKPGAIK
jgi:hypothetical protein